MESSVDISQQTSVDRRRSSVTQYANQIANQPKTSIRYYIIIIAILALNPVLSLIIGLIYKDQCTIDRRIPIYLIVFGVFGCVFGILMVVTNILSRRSVPGSRILVWITIVSLFSIMLIGLFLFAWLIVGSTFTFSIFHSVQYSDLLSSAYCHQTLYQFTFCMIIITYITPIIVMIISLINTCIDLKKCFKTVLTSS